MKSQAQKDYERIEKAIHFALEHFKSQPTLEQMAKAVELGPHHFQRLFKEWVGVSPKKFIQFISLGYAKELLKQQTSLLEAAHQIGLSGSARLHDLFITIEGMTPGEYKDGGANLLIRYQLSVCQFGKIIVGSTHKGVCFLSFYRSEKEALKKLKSEFPRAQLRAESDDFQLRALSIFNEDWTKVESVKLHLAATPFQLKVWQTLLLIPCGELTTYQDIARYLKSPNSSRAVGNAIGKNPIAFLIPCHRVIRSTGLLGGYRWGLPRKAAIIGWEAVKK